MQWALRGLVVALAVGWAAPAAHAQTDLVWWVADQETAVEVRAALQDLWPGHELEVRVGSPSGDEEGIFYRSPELILYVGGRVWREESGEHPATQVALARSWIRETDVSDTGWAPEIRTQPEPEPEPVPRVNTNPLRGFVLGGAGAQYRPGSLPGLHAAGQAGVSFIPAFGVTALLAADVLESDEVSGESLRIDRGSAMGGVVLHSGGTVAVMGTLAAGIRFADVNFPESGDGLSRVWLPSGTARLHLFGNGGDSPLHVGGGLGVDVDTAHLSDVHVFTRLGGADYSSQVSLHLELTVLFGDPWDQRKKP